MIALLLLACNGAADDAAAPDPCAGEPTLTADGASITFALDGCGSLELTGRAVGTGEIEISAEVDAAAGTFATTATAMSEGAVLEAVIWEGAWTLTGDEPARIWRQGYQSWAWAGVSDLVPIEADADGVPLSGATSADASFLDDTSFSSWWVGLVGRADGASLLAGALSHHALKFTASFDEDRAVIVWGGRGEAVQLAFEERYSAGAARLALGSEPWQMHRDYAEAVAERTPPPDLSAPPQVGWATWYQFYTEIDEPLVLSQLDEAVALAGDASLAPFEVFQIDDGWQAGWGDWTAGDHFPSGTAALADAIEAAGFRPGLWMAPFYVDRESETYAAHPDWWVLDADGEEITYDGFSGWDYVILDTTHPEAKDWLHDLVADKVAEGWTYLKLDFLFGAAQEGVRYQDVTGLEAYHQGMQILRDAADANAAAGGEDVWILACGAPMLPSLGYAESFRTGADIAFELSTEPALDYLRWQARSNAGRSWTNGIWWWNDPDQIIVREPFGDAETTGAVATNATSGGVWFLGDDLTALPDERLSMVLDPDLVALRGATARPLNPLRYPSGVDAGPIVEEIQPDDQVPRIWELETGEVVLMNFSDDPQWVEGPGGTELIGGDSAPAGPRYLEVGAGEIWRP